MAHFYYTRKATCFMAQATPLKRVHGYLAEFDSAKSVYEAAEKVRDAGFSHWDVHSPFPIHGMDDAMGLPKSILPNFVLVGGACGTLTAFLLEYLTQVVIYPTVVHSKPGNLFTIPAFFPVMFELTILFAAFTTLFGCLALMKLPWLNHPLFNSSNFLRFSDDTFFICIEQRDPKFSLESTKNFLGDLGGKNVELIEAEI
jgi:hypothetical protein